MYTRKDLYPWNKKAYDLSMKYLKENGLCINTNATYTGKTPTALAIISNYKHPYIIGPSNELIEFNFPKEIPHCTYSKLSIGTFKLPKDTDIIIFDEFHTALANQREFIIYNLLNNCKKCNIYAMTATPYRTDGKNILNLFGDNHVCTITRAEAVKLGVIKKPRYFASVLNETYKKVNGKKYYHRYNFFESSNLIREISNKHKVIIFCKNNDEIKSLQPLFTSVFKKYGFDIGVYTSMYEDKKYIDIFKNKINKKMIVFTVNKMNAGYHINDCDCIIMLRHSASSAIIDQQLGRVLKMLDSKYDSTVIDLALNKSSISHILINEYLREKILVNDDVIDGRSIVERNYLNNLRTLFDVELDLELKDPFKGIIVEYEGEKCNLTDVARKLGVYPWKVQRAYQITGDIYSAVEYIKNSTKEWAYYNYKGKRYKIGDLCDILGIKSSDKKNFSHFLKLRNITYVNDHIINLFVNRKKPKDKFAFYYKNVLYTPYTFCEQFNYSTTTFHNLINKYGNNTNKIIKHLEKLKGNKDFVKIIKSECEKMGIDYNNYQTYCKRNNMSIKDKTNLYFYVNKRRNYESIG